MTTPDADYVKTLLPDTKARAWVDEWEVNYEVKGSLRNMQRKDRAQPLFAREDVAKAIAADREQRSK